MVLPIDKQKTTIVESGAMIDLQFKELWNHRELIFFLGWRDVLARYRQTSLSPGLLWALVQPITSVATLTFVMGKLAKIPSDGMPYPVFVFIGILAWQYIAAVAASAQSNGLITGYMMTKVYFPPLALPLSILIPPTVDFFVGAFAFCFVMLIWHCVPSLNIIWLPLFLFLMLLIALAVSFWILALTITFRDLRHVFPFVFQILYMASPVFYSNTIVPENLALIYNLNPIACVIEGFRWSILGTGNFPNPLPSMGISILLIFIGLWIYGRVVRVIADII